MKAGCDQEHTNASDYRYSETLQGLS